MRKEKYPYIEYLPEEVKEELSRKGAVAILEYRDYDEYPDFTYVPIDSLFKFSEEYKDAMSYRILTKNGEEIHFDDFEEFINYLREHF